MKLHRPRVKLIFEISINNGTIKEIVEKWDALGYLNGIPEDKREILAINFENMGHYLIYDNEDDTNECFEAIIFNVIRKLASEVPIKFDCRMLTKYVLNSKCKDVQKYVNNDVEKIIEQNKDRGIFDLLNKEKIDLESEICTALSEYLIDKLK